MSANVMDYSKAWSWESLSDKRMSFGMTSKGVKKELPCTKVMRMKREATEVRNAVIDAIEKAEMSRHSLAARKKEVREKEGQLKESLGRFEETFQETEEIYRSQMKKVEKERQLINQVQAKCDALQEKINYCTKQRDRLKEEVGKAPVYSDFLEKVVKASQTFQDKSEAMARFNTVRLHLQGLERAGQRRQEALDRAQAQLVHITDQSFKKTLLLRNNLNKIRSQLDKVHNERLYWESRWNHIQNTATEKSKLLCSHRLAILCLYQDACKMVKYMAGPVPLEDSLSQLEKIAELFPEMLSIWKEARLQVQTSWKKGQRRHSQTSTPPQETISPIIPWHLVQ